MAAKKIANADDAMSPIGVAIWFGVANGIGNREIWKWCGCFASLIVATLVASLAPAQEAIFVPGGDAPPVELSSIIQVHQADHAAVALLEIAKAHIAERQWAEAIDKLQQVEESAGGKLFKVDERRYVPLREYSQSLVAQFPAEALAIYRERVDSLARGWYENGVAARDPALLRKVVDQAFNSSYGDDALLVLGEIALERGEPKQAFALWERISHKLRPAGGLPLWLPYPDTNLNLADVRARLVLASILAGDLRWARVELKALLQNHPQAKGKLGGREVVYAEALAEMIEAAKSWASVNKPNIDWPTFAGSPTRQHISPGVLVLKNPLTDFSVEAQKLMAPVTVEAPGFVAPNSRALGLQPTEPALSYFPVVARGLLLFSSADEVFAYSASTGRPAWQGDSKKPGRIFWGGKDNSVKAAPPADRSLAAAGAPRFTLTVFDRWLLARMGPPVASRAFEFQPRRDLDAGYIVCLDLAAEGRLHWKLTPDEINWAFEGSPVCDGSNVYVAMRYSDGTGTPQQHVACFDLQTGTRRWRQLVCAAQSASPGIGDNSLNLLTLAGDNIFINTNLGAVASLDTTDGHIRWLAQYPRNRAFAVTEGLRQNFNPAIYDGGMLYVAPSDFRGILALDAYSGQLRWDSDHEHEVAELLGISGGKLWASNQRLWALDARSGKVEYHSGGGSDNPRTPVGHGRGLLAGGKVYWPVRVGKADDNKNSDFQIRVFDSQSTQELPPLGLKTIKPPCESGNLLMTKENVVIASPDQITLYLLTPET